MEGLTRLVSESLVRYGLERPLDYRRLRWSSWFRCESHHSLLQVPSKPGVFAIAEEITGPVEERHFGAAPSSPTTGATSAAEGGQPEGESPKQASVGRVLAVTRFFEDDDMAYVLDRMLTRENPLRDSLNSGRYFIRFVAIEDRFQRRSIFNSLKQWQANSAERASGIGSHFAKSLELTPTDRTHAGRTLLSDTVNTSKDSKGTNSAELKVASPSLDSGAAANLHCPSPFPSGF